jgi:4-hydroxy-3-polyprenylbenzoate decarboxylase
MRIIVGITGASGAIYGIRLLEALAEIDGIETHVVITQGGKVNIALETTWRVKDVESLADVAHSEKNLAAPISSGSFLSDGMVIAPCSMKTLSGVVNSYAENLVIRAADVVLKEKRMLVLLTRESPLHVGHTRLLHEAALMGGIICPPSPAFYNAPTTVDDIVNHSIGRVLDLFGIDNSLVQRWTGPVRAAPAGEA